MKFDQARATVDAAASIGIPVAALLIIDGELVFDQRYRIEAQLADEAETFLRALDGEP